MARKREDSNIINIDGSRFEGPGRGKGPGFWQRITPAHIGAVVLMLVFIYLCINLYLYKNRDQVSIYEVQNANISYQTVYEGVCIRDEHLISATHSGYVNYFIQNGRRVAKSGVVFSVDASGNNVYSQINKDYEDYSFSSEEISEIKSMISGAMRDYNGADLGWSGEFCDNITETIYDLVSTNILDRIETVREGSSSGSDFHYERSSSSGIVTYRADSLTGLTADEVSSETFEKDRYKEFSLKSTGLIGSGDPVYRICPTENWSVVTLVSEEFYINNLENKEITIFINGNSEPLKGTLKMLRKDKDYLAQVDLDYCLSDYIDERFVNVEFFSDTEDGLKVPLTAVTTKEFYLVPLSMFTADEGYAGYVLKREKYDETDGSVSYEDIYTSKYYSDGYYAYIDKSVLNEGDYLCNTITGERVRVSSVGELDGVYCVNKGYYVFTRVEKLRANNEYVIVRKNTGDGLRLYDHIALNSSDAVEGNIISTY